MTNEMSNEEAKEIIIQERDSLKANPAVKVENCLYEAFDVAIRALEQQPCEDCISRQAVLDIWHTCYSNIREENEEIQYKKIAFKLPSVTPKQKVGKWIRSWCEWQQYLECSKCGYETGLRCDTNYCPNCGAKMEVEDEK